jgi:hypothetical protein
VRVALLLLMVVGLAACERPLVVRADPTGTEKQPLAGRADVRGALSRALKLGDRVVPKGTPVVVEETWLLRKQGGGFRMSGLYDPAVRTDGLMLPRGTVDVVFYAAVLPERRVRIPVPQEAFRPDG